MTGMLNCSAAGFTGTPERTMFMARCSSWDVHLEARDAYTSEIKSTTVSDVLCLGLWRLRSEIANSREILTFYEDISCNGQEPIKIIHSVVMQDGMWNYCSLLSVTMYHAICQAEVVN